jgi:hypothetical protein
MTDPVDHVDRRGMKPLGLWTIGSVLAGVDHKMFDQNAPDSNHSTE